VVAAAFAFLLCYRLTILRHALTARLPDLAAVYAICTVVVLVQAIRFVRGRIQVRPVLAVATALAAFVVVLSASSAIADTVGLRSELSESSLLRGPRAIYGRALKVLSRGMSDSWDAYWPAGGVPPAIAYLTSCTGDRDRLLMTWPSAEYHFFARRPFAAGHLEFFHRDSFSSERDQTQAVERLRQQYVPVALINETSYGEFREAFPLIADYIATHYEQSGQFTIRDGSQVAIAVRRDLRPRRTFGDEHWPCDFEVRDRASLHLE
jgi:hypothetical protein